MGLVGFFSVLLVLGTIFSMGSTIWGLRTTMEETIRIDNTSINQDDTEYQNTKMLYQNIVDRKTQALKTLESEMVKRDGFVDAINGYSEKFIEDNPDFYSKQNGRRYVADKAVETAKKDYDDIVLEEKLYLESNVVVVSDKKEIPDNAYTWIADKVFKGMSADNLQFWMSVYPALFYDIISPVSFSIVFFLSGNMKKKSIKKKTGKHRKRGKKR